MKASVKIWDSFISCNQSFTQLFTFIQERIFEDGKDALQHEFKSLLNRHGRPVPPIVILDLLNTDEGMIAVMYCFILSFLILNYLCVTYYMYITFCDEELITLIFSLLPHHLVSCTDYQQEETEKSTKTGPRFILEMLLLSALWNDMIVYYLISEVVCVFVSRAVVDVWILVSDAPVNAAVRLYIWLLLHSGKEKWTGLILNTSPTRRLTG